MTTPAFPLPTRIARFKLTLNENKAAFPSLFTRGLQVVSLGAGTSDRWEGLLETAPLTQSQVATLFAFLTSVGIWGAFTATDPDYPGPASGQSTILVMGGSQSGTSLVCDAATPSVKTLAAGEYFQIGTEFKQVTQDCTANGSGQVTLVFKPALRASPADNASVVLNTPVMTVLLAADASKDTDSLKMGVFTIPFQEQI